MKRFFLLLTGLLLAGALSFAQSVDGNWFLSQDIAQSPETAGQVEGRLAITLQIGGSRFTQSVHMTTKMTEAVLQAMTGGQGGACFEISADCTFSGSCTREGDILTMVPDKKKPKVDVKTNIKGIPGGEMMAEAMKQPMQTGLAQGSENEIRYKIVSVTASEMTLSSLPASKGEKSETLVFKRK